MGEAGKAGVQASATTMVEVATSNTRNRGTRSRCSPGSSTSHPHGNNSSHNSRPHDNSSSDIRSHNSGDRGISNLIPGPAGKHHLPIRSSPPGPAGRDHPPNSSTGTERPTGGDDIGEEISTTISRTGSDTFVSGAARRSISPQSAGQLRPHQRRRIIRTGHHLFPGSYAAQSSTCPPPPRTSHDSDGHFDRVQLRISAANQKLCTCPADATTPQI